MFGFLKKMWAPTQEIEVEMYDDDLTIKSVHIVDGMSRIDGVREEFYPNGKLSARSHYCKGRLNGPCLRYYENGQLHERKMYDNQGLLTGEYQSFYPNGQLLTRGNYVKGEKEGVFKSYYTNGQIMKECSYHAGKLEGIYTVYSIKGNVIRQKICHREKERTDERDSPKRQELCRLLAQVNKQMEPTAFRQMVRKKLAGQYRSGYLIY